MDSDGDGCVSEAEFGMGPVGIMFKCNFTAISGDGCLVEEKFDACMSIDSPAGGGSGHKGPCAPPCKCELFTSAQGNFSDGSEDNKYDSNADCRWVIAPPASDSKFIVLEFDAFEVEGNYAASSNGYLDFVTINSCDSLDYGVVGVPKCVGSRQVTRLSGDLDALSGPYVSGTGIMEVVLSTDYSVSKQVDIHTYTHICMHT